MWLSLASAGRTTSQPGMARREVAADPLQSRRVVPHHLPEVGVGGRGRARRRTGMAVADLLYGVCGQDTGGVHRTLVRLGPLQAGQ
ncbi:hypothetical protein ADL02_22530 [Streptomyces sp. NRRL WC-3723]|nr:hypothetical protein ADL02_22530 [Streptomyces sp. NRRL WC-3723]